MSEFHFQPIKGKAREILKAILQTPEVSSCSLKVGFVLRLACEEIVMNVTSYAYPNDVEGFLDVEIEKSDHRIVIRFKDGGTAYLSTPWNDQSPTPSYIGNNVALAVWASSSSSKRWMPSAMLTRTITMY